MISFKWFEIIGRILNRFSKDIGTIDNELSGKLHSTFDVITDKTFVITDKGSFKCALECS